MPQPENECVHGVDLNRDCRECDMESHERLLEREARAMSDKPDMDEEEDEFDYEESFEEEEDDFDDDELDADDLDPEDQEDLIRHPEKGDKSSA